MKLFISCRARDPEGNKLFQIPEGNKFTPTDRARKENRQELHSTLLPCCLGRKVKIEYFFEKDLILTFSVETRSLLSHLNATLDRTE